MNTWHKHIAPLLAVGCLVVTPQAHAAESEAPPPAWQGIWHGTIGKAEVQACLQHEGYDDFGAYYYMRHLAIISLDTVVSDAPGDALPVWTESPNSAQPEKSDLWHITSVTTDHMRGLWTGGGKTLPIDLTRVATTATDSENGPCGSQAFSLPRFTKPVITTEPAALNGVAYTHIIANPGQQFSDSAIETFQLQGSTPAIQHVNAELYKTIPTGPDDAEYFQCSMAALGQNGWDGDSSSTRRPLVISKSWLVVQEDGSWNCGGAHPDAATTYQTWDLGTGTTVNLYDWFNAQALEQTVHDAGTADAYTTVTLTAPFKKMIDDAYPNYDDDADCKEARQDADAWNVHLTSTGVDFTPDLPHVAQACIDDAILPFASLEPYLSPAGKAGVASFTAEVLSSR